MIIGRNGFYGELIAAQRIETHAIADIKRAAFSIVKTIVLTIEQGCVVINLHYAPIGVLVKSLHSIANRKTMMNQYVVSRFCSTQFESISVT